MEFINRFVEKYLFWVSFPHMTPIDVIEIIIISFIMYQIMLWIKNTRAWMLFKGIMVLLGFVLVASIFQMNTILWIANKTVNVGIIGMIIVFQPEFRKALEQLGRKNILSALIPFDNTRNSEERFSDKTKNEIVRATFEMARGKVGALIVIEGDIILSEYERTGIAVDGIVSAQLLMNIFEHNTPLHDGAIIIRENRIVSATCYLPLSDDMGLSKDLGTRHRAGVGISEVTDTLTIIVSEETGGVSIAVGGELIRNIDSDYLKERLSLVQKKSMDVKKRFRLKKGRDRIEE